MRSNPYDHENLRHGAFHYLMGRGAAGIAGFLTVLLLVRFMDLHNYAAYTALSGLVAICGVIAGLGMERVVARYVPEARLYRSVDELSRFIWVTSGIRLVAALVIVGVLFAFWPEVDHFLVAADFKIFSAGLAFFIVGETMFQHFSSVLQSLVMQKMLTRLLVIQWAGKLLIITLIVLLKSTIDWQDSLWIFAIPELIGVVTFVFVIRSHLGHLADEHHELTQGKWPQWGRVAEVGLHNFGFTLLAAPPQGYFMKVLSAAYLPVEVVAAYGFFLSVAEKARQYIPLHFFYGLLEPMMIAGYLKDRDFSALSYRCQLLYKSNLLLMVPAMAWVAVAGDSIAGLMTGGKFEGLSWILVLVMMQLTIGSHVVLLQLLLNSLEKSKILVMASTMALPTMLLGMAISVVTNPMWLLSTPILFSLVMNLYIVFRLAQGNHPYQPSWKILGGVSFSGLVAFGAIEMLKLLVPITTSSFIVAFMSLVGVITVYFLAILAFKAIDQSEVELIKSIVLNLRRKTSDVVPSATAQIPEAAAPFQNDPWGGRRLIEALQIKARTVLDPLIPVGASLALLDYPNNSNVGDSLIWLGEMAYLKSRDASLAYLCDIKNYNPARLTETLGEDSIILLHGGGNFGTLWPEEHQFRLRVLHDFPGRKIIQFSQSIFFDDPDLLEETVRAIQTHGSFTLLVRDEKSLEFAAKHFPCEVILCPDMAFFIGPIYSADNPVVDRFILSRTDHEKSANWLDDLSLIQHGLSVETQDWLRAGWDERFLCRIERHTKWLRKVFDPYNRSLGIIWNQLAICRFGRGRRLLERGRVVISDRLHVHILALLLDKPHALIDNSNRKISGLHQAWTTPYQGVIFAKNLCDAFAVADSFDLKAMRNV